MYIPTHMYAYIHMFHFTSVRTLSFFQFLCPFTLICMNTFTSASSPTHFTNVHMKQARLFEQCGTLAEGQVVFITNLGFASVQ